MRRHCGSSMAILLIFVLFSTTLLGSLLVLTTTVNRAIRQEAVNGTVIYSLMAMGELAMDAVLYDVSQSSATAPFPLVGKGVAGIYDATLQAVQANLFPNNTTYVVDALENLILYDGGQLENAASMKEELLTFAKHCTLEINLHNNLEIDEGNEANQILFETGDTAVLKAVSVTVTLGKGITKLTQEYRITGILASFYHDETVVQMTISCDEARKELIRQTIVD